MKNKEIILWLILQDLQHQRLACHRCCSYLSDTETGISILDVILKLIDPEHCLTEAQFDELSQVYYGFLDKTEERPVPTKEELRQLIEQCFQLLIVSYHFRCRVMYN